MSKQNFHFALPLLAIGILLSGCEQEVGTLPATGRLTTTDTQVAASPGAVTPATEMAAPGPDLPEPAPTQFNVGNKSYLFDVSDHSLEELEALLGRAEEITQMSSNDYDKLDIVMILHGPDIGWFTQQNYERNKRLVDLAAKLDAYDIIDIKVCETAMNSLGIEREEIPAFIESVPYSPDEMKRLLKEGYINL